MSRMNYRWSCPDRNSIVGRKKNNKNNWRRKKGRLVGNLVWCREEIREDNLYYFCLMSNFRLYLRPIFMTKKSYLYEIWFPILNMEISQGGFWVHITSVKTTRYWKENIRSGRHNQVNKTKENPKYFQFFKILTNKVVTFPIVKVWIIKFWFVPPKSSRPTCDISLSLSI